MKSSFDEILSKNIARAIKTAQTGTVMAPQPIAAVEPQKQTPVEDLGNNLVNQDEPTPFIEAMNSIDNMAFTLKRVKAGDQTLVDSIISEVQKLKGNIITLKDLIN
jgi:hypothetical protein